jgi:hypothetical protein
MDIKETAYEIVQILENMRILLIITRHKLQILMY